MPAAQHISPHAPPPTESLSAMFVTRIWHLISLRKATAEGLSLKTGIPMDTLLRLYSGKDELTADQLVRFATALDVHPLAIFDGIVGKPKIVPEQLMDREVAELAARLHDMPKVGRDLLMATAAKGHTMGALG